MRNSLKALLVTLSLAGAACGGSDGGKDLDKFVGLWSPTSGTYSQTCPTDDYNTFSYQVVSTETWAVGTTSDLVQTDSANSCVFHAGVSSDTATDIPAGQTCTVNGIASDNTPYTQVSTFGAYTFVVSPDRSTATENDSGSLVLTFEGPDGYVDNCTFTQTASYSKQ